MKKLLLIALLGVTMGSAWGASFPSKSEKGALIASKLDELLNTEGVTWPTPIKNALENAKALALEGDINRPNWHKIIVGPHIGIYTESDEKNYSDSFIELPGRYAVLRGEAILRALDGKNPFPTFDEE